MRHPRTNTQSTSPLSNICCYFVLPWWVTVPCYYQSHHHPVCVPVCECVLEVCVCFLVGGWTNMSFWIRGCRVNIDQHAQRHAAGQIKHSSDGHRAQRANVMPYHLDELATVCQTDDTHTLHSERGRERRGWTQANIHAATVQHVYLDLYLVLYKYTHFTF